MKEKSLLQLKRFWLPVLFVIVVAVAIAIYIYKSSSLVFVPGYEGLDGLVKIYKVPLGVLSLLFPLVALIATSHRSEQTKKQIEMSYLQNSFSNFYKHLEEFDKLVNKSNDFGLREFNPFDLYKILFPLNSPSNVITCSHGKDKGAVSKLNEIATKLVDKVSLINEFKGDYNKLEVVYIDFFVLLINASIELSFIPRPNNAVRWVKFKGFDVSFPLFTTSLKPFLHYDLLSNYINQLSGFGMISVEMPELNIDEKKNILAQSVLIDVTVRS
ncbi:hypothetical protein [Halomonas sp. Cn5-12]|uniref:hypothetical protein n=1 Tax=Halomonas sp. Cn5-12 TaxID=2908885 RepID=UPI001F1805EC|nr:hypothetical protein [Halomonas sp. Cn5-12]MCF2911871.1 hypothetical protein [Halomonas sp. Cn5-12]